jgi:hypothetical protein
MAPCLQITGFARREPNFGTPTGDQPLDGLRRRDVRRRDHRAAVLALDLSGHPGEILVIMRRQDDCRRRHGPSLCRSRHRSRDPPRVRVRAVPREVEASRSSLANSSLVSARAMQGTSSATGCSCSTWPRGRRSRRRAACSGSTVPPLRVEAAGRGARARDPAPQRTAAAAAAHPRGRPRVGGKCECDDHSYCSPYLRRPLALESAPFRNRAVVAGLDCGGRLVDPGEGGAYARQPVLEDVFRVAAR